MNLCIGAIWVAFDNNLFVWQSKPWSNYCLSRVKRIKVKVDWLKNSCHQSIYFECFVCFASTISCSLSHPMASSSIARVLLAVFAVQVKQIHIFRTHTEYWANLWETQNNCSSNLTSFPFAVAKHDVNYIFANDLEFWFRNSLSFESFFFIVRPHRN